jgi:putative MATE family efflux protein
MWLALVIGMGVTAVGLVLSGPLVGWMGAEGAVRTNALVYLRISLLGVPAMLLVLAGAGYLRGLQDTRTPLLIAIGTAAANLVIEVALIYGLDQGIGASALATVLAQVGGAAVYIRRVGHAARRQGADLAPHPASLAALAGVGRDLLVRTAALRAALVVATAVAARLGSVDVAAHQIAFEIWSFLALGLDAIAIAGQAMVGRALGAGDGPGARDAGRRMIEWGVALGAVVGVLVAALRTVLPHLFTDDVEVLALASFLLVWVAALQPLNAVAFVLDGVLIGAGDMRFLAWAMIVAAAVFIPAALAVLALDAGIGWLWASLGLLMATRASTLLARFASGRWIILGARR